MTGADHKQQARFEQLVLAADKGALGFDGLRELSHLYRVCSASLSLQRTRAHDPEAIQYLNALCLRAYSHVYVEAPRARSRSHFWLLELPGALGRTLRMQLAAAALLAVGALLGACVALEDEANLSAVVPAAMYPADALHSLWSSEPARRAFLARGGQSFTEGTWFAGSLFANNTRVGLLSLAVGVLGAWPTTLLLLYNGLLLGGFSAIFMRGPERLEFLAWIVPHAVPELLAIVLCSAGGLAMGASVLAPGRKGRRVALREAASDALLLLASSVPLFVVAALIESFVRQSTWSTTARFVVASAATLALLGYVFLVRWYATRPARVDLAFLEVPVTTTPPRGSAGSDRAPAR